MECCQEKSERAVRSKLLSADPPVTYAVVLDTGDEVIESLIRFTREREIEAASVTGIGAFAYAVLGYFDWQIKEYRRIPVNGQVEVLSLLGDVAVSDTGRPCMCTPCSARPTAASSAVTCSRPMSVPRWR